MKMTILAITLALTSATALAHPHPSYDYLSLSYLSVDDESLDDNYQYSGLQGGALLGKHVFMRGAYQKTDTGVSVDGLDVELDLSTFVLGVGYRDSVTHVSDWYVGGFTADSNGSLDIQNTLFVFDGTVYGAFAGYIHRFGDFETNIGLEYGKQDGQSDYVGATFSCRYFFNPTWSLGLDVFYEDDVSMYGASVRYHF